MARRRGGSSSMIILLVFLILVIGGITAGYVAVDRKIIENPFSKILETLKGEPVVEPSGIPETPSIEPSVENEFFAVTNKPKHGKKPEIAATEDMFTIGDKFVCTNNGPRPEGETRDLVYKYVDKLTVDAYLAGPLASTYHMVDAQQRVIRNCDGLKLRNYYQYENRNVGDVVYCENNDPATSDALKFTHPVSHYGNVSQYVYQGNGLLKPFPDDITRREHNSAVGQWIYDCTNYKVDIPYVHAWPSGTTVKCAANDPRAGTEATSSYGWYYRYGGNGNLIPYPDTTTTDSWDPNWRTSSTKTIANCSSTHGYTLVDAGTYKYGGWSNGTPLKCATNDPKGANEVAVYRYEGNGVMAYYPDSTTASSWDSDWATTYKTIENCDGYTVSKNIPVNYPEGTTVKCTANDPRAGTEATSSYGWYYRYDGNGGLIPYPDTTTTGSWDPNWRTGAKTIPDCSSDNGYTLLDAGNYKYVGWSNGTPLRCQRNDPKGANEVSLYAHRGNGNLSYYPDTETANDEDPDWASTYKTIENCDGYTLAEPFKSSKVEFADDDDSYYEIYKSNFGGRCKVDDTSKQLICKPQNTSGTKFKLELVSGNIKALKAYFDASNAKYCADTPSGVVCDRDSIGDWEKFDFTHAGGGEYTLNGGRSNNKCTSYNNKPIECGLPSTSTLAQKFLVNSAPAPEPPAPPPPPPPPPPSQDLTSGTYTIRKNRNSSNNSYCIILDGALNCRKSKPRTDAVNFIFEKVGDKYALKAQLASGAKYCADTPSGVVCDRNSIGSWEKFTVDQVSFYDEGTYGYNFTGGRSGNKCYNLFESPKNVGCTLSGTTGSTYYIAPA